MSKELETQTLKSDRKAWDATTMGFGKHKYQSIDPDTINPEDYAVSLRGEEKQFGDVRQYNSAFNEKHPENDTNLDWLARTETEFETDAEGYQGHWRVTNMPVVRRPEVYSRVTRVDPEGNLVGEETEIPCSLLGVAVDRNNLFAQIRTKMITKGKVDREQRLRLTKR